MKRSLVTFLPLVALVILALLFVDRLSDPRRQGTIDSPLLGQPVPPGIVEGVEGAYIINFFASWCAPCVVEHPVLMNLKKQGVTIIGLVYKDTTENIDAFLARRGNPYARIILDDKGADGIIMGITGVPESFAVDKNGIIRARYQGPLTDPGALERILEGLKS